MLEPSHIVVIPFKSLKTLKVSVKRIWLSPISTSEKLKFNKQKIYPVKFSEMRWLIYWNEMKQWYLFCKIALKQYFSRSQGEHDLTHSHNPGTTK